ncbi:MarR family winged helix-turn-helix transcriptional regulator [Celeribacter litoreus]|uniref:MarR family winged helix-turn-helix transcriptional regulator n=1 Tax=Celeribacter litoreus TaxID=2876714 RepID=UPI001CCCDFC4|nr:MarR family winged helix-turn-helix transcriptional regulator [Celeribacter litoreus]MCA0043069.1 MarR family winged helix-turn-helix transcriptional regulator [Celeribacter litoreus]
MPNPPLDEVSKKPEADVLGDPRIRAGVPDLLAAQGFSAGSIEALLALDIALFKWRRMAEKGEFKGKVLKDMPETLEPALLQGLFSVAQISAGLGREKAELPTIGMVAEVMAVDPSRASRVTSELVSRGYLERRPSQEDARKSVLAMTPMARKFMAGFTLSKWRVLTQVFDGWSEEDVVAFNRLFTKYASGLSAALASD